VYGFLERDAMLTFELDVTDHGETLVYAVSSRGNGERMLFAAANQAAAAAELADFLNDAAREFGYQPASCG
jgi:hypothetical protein